MLLETVILKEAEDAHCKSKSPTLNIMENFVTSANSSAIARRFLNKTVAQLHLYFSACHLCNITSGLETQYSYPHATRAKQSGLILVLLLAISFAVFDLTANC